MKRVAILMIACMFLWTQATPASEASATDVHGHGQAMPPGGTMLPSPETARDVLNATGRHGDWLRIPVGTAEIVTFVVYPDRADKAPVLIISEKDRPMSDWMRGIADQAAGEGYIALVPDTFAHLSQDARIDAVRKFALNMPPVNGNIASMTFSAERIDLGNVAFERSQQGWTDAINLLNTRLENHPTLIALPSHNHMGHEGIGVMAMAAPEPQRDAERPCQVGSLDCKADGYLAGFNSARSTLARSPVRSQWVDLPVGNAKVHTKIAYPPGNGKAGVIIVMSGATGQNDWQLAVGDELARQGFIAISPDLHSGFGPNGGNYDSFEFPDDVVKAGQRISSEEAMRRYKAALAYGLKLPEANGKSASIGFCGGGTRSFQFAVEVPELSAAVVYYGTGPTEADVAKIKAPVLGLYGEIDSRITSTVDATTATMRKLGKSYEPHIYKGATHAFVQYQNLGENTAATKEAWPRTIAFLKEHLK